MALWDKCHIGIDKYTRLISYVETTSASVHDLTRVADPLHKPKLNVYA